MTEKTYKNPFEVDVPSALTALMTGVAGYDRARKSVKEDETKAARQSALARLIAGDTQGAFADTLGAGDTDGAKAISTLAENQANRAWREQEALRSQSNTDRAFGLQQRNADRSYGLQREQFDATMNANKVPAGFQRGPDGALTFVPGGPADPTYLGNVANAKKAPKDEDTFGNEQKLRKEFEATTKPHLEVRRGFDRVLASKDDAAGDIGLIFGFMKMLDPGSVVREGEFATAQNAASIPDQVRNAYNRALEGTRLNPGQRNMFKGQASALYDRSKREYQARESQMRGIASKYGFDPDRIIPSIGLEPTAVGAPNIPAPPAGFKVVP